MKKNIIFTMLAVLSIIPFNFVQAKSVDELEKVDPCKAPLLKEIGEIDRNETVTINGVKNPLYCTFNNKEQALTNLKNKIPNFLNYLADNYNLGPLSSSNWKKYRESMYDYISKNIDVNKEFNENSIEYRTLRQFFDIYENDSKNLEIKNYVSSKFSITASTDSQLITLLPYYAPLAQEFNNSILTRPKVLSDYFNVSFATSYAIQYAVNPNSANYNVFSEDCTNFVSQILEAAGISQVVYDNENYGWWHKKERKCVLFVCWDEHTHSISWVRADTFARYMGIGYTTDMTFYFSENIREGDFVAADFDSDGDWDHMGYVTGVDGSPFYHNGLYYYDFSIAQHTGNYHAYASTSTNSWESIPYDGGRYARVRR